MKYQIVYADHIVNFENYTQLVNYLIKSRHVNWDNRVTNDVFDRVKVSDNDLCYAEINTDKVEYISCGSIRLRKREYGWIKRDIRIIDEFGNNAYNDILIRDVNRFTYREDIEKARVKFIRNSKTHWVGRFTFPDNTYPGFRNGPIPYTGIRYRGHMYRDNHYIAYKRDASDPDMKPFVRKSYLNSLPDVWDGSVRSNFRSKSWKNNGKYRHQWERNANNNSRHTFGRTDYISLDMLSYDENLSDAG